MKHIKILFIGDIFGQPGLKTVEKLLPALIKEHQIDFVIAQGENTTGRKGLSLNDYQTMLNIGINAITMGNHIWANDEIFSFIENSNVIRPFNVSIDYPGLGSKEFKVNDITLRVTSMMGRSFNTLLKPWNEEMADDFFDAVDLLLDANQADFHFIDFHGETTSEKNVFGLYCDGKVDAICGTHTHVQTNDARVLPQGTCYITDAGMTGPQNCAIGANFEEVYKKMRYDAREPFKVSDNLCQFNAVVIKLYEDKSLNKIKPINIMNINY
ncbi:metallophosphatase [Mycoplasma sp. NEAQ87857]|uniref:TIGR00282 family metallophosphoesterase n=1 Tax=Mycoplasma sp. NEAQ87857 TaxID=2683967 RepID=UPI00131833CE|nr:TIGR00282 family metallophosphoesterase [Mycoplasma sp. NEAQ87857]QGZ97726.1 metallophosphatase [Mycoplasma sp. NEAQ87857]